MIGIGALVGVGLILLDEMLGAAHKLRIPPLAVGIGIYLPMSATFAVVVGAVISHWYDKRARQMPNPERAERLGTLVASGLIVGESIWGVINAGTDRRAVEGRADRARAGKLRAGAVARVAAVRGGDRVAVRLDVAKVESCCVERRPVKRRLRATAVVG